MSSIPDDFINSATHRLSKSAIAAFDQCPRRLWLQVHLPDAAATSDGSAQLRLTAGTQVGAAARVLIAEGALVNTGPNMQAAIAKTAELSAKADQPIFEATLIYPLIPLTHVEHSATYGAWKRNHLLHRLNFRSASSLRASRPMMPVSITSWPFASAGRALPAHHAARKVATTN